MECSFLAPVCFVVITVLFFMLAALLFIATELAGIRMEIRRLVDAFTRDSDEETK